MGVKIITGHNNMDLDCIGSIVMARYLFPDHQPVVQRLIHPVARAIYNLYQNELNFVTIHDLGNKDLERAVIVDTKSYSRVREVLDVLSHENAEFEIFDHHENESSEEFPNAVVHDVPCGANVTQLVLEIMKRDIHVKSLDATIALAGIYSDTGYFAYQNVTSEDFIAASYLLEHEASINIISKYMRVLKENYQLELFHKIMNDMIYQEINGHFIILAYVVLEKQKGGLAAVIEQLSDVEKPDAVFGIFSFTNDDNVLIVARSSSAAINCEKIMSFFGGGGHQGASSAMVKKTKGVDTLQKLLDTLKVELNPAVSAKTIMQRDIQCIKDVWNMMQASLFLEQIDHSGAPVTNEQGKLLGMITLKDIMKARRSDQMHVPVKSHMKTKLVTCKPETTIRNIETILYDNNIGHLPVMENGEMVGFITRSDVLRFAHEK